MAEQQNEDETTTKSAAPVAVGDEAADASSSSDNKETATAVAAASATTATATTTPSAGGTSATTAATTSRPPSKLPQPSSVPKPATTTTPAASSSSSSGKPPSVEKVREHLNNWFSENKLNPQDSSELRILLKDYDSLKEKVTKLKSLLGRSAKAQREATVDLKATQKRLDASLREVERLNRKIDKMANRPTHMELLADFETNFDRALLSVGNHSGQNQPGGQDTGASPTPAISASMQRDSISSSAKDIMNETAVVDSLLMQELNDAKHRIEKLENLNSALVSRSSQLESDVKHKQREQNEMSSKVSRLELEKRMAVMEAEHATKAMEEKAASLKEMQMEIDLVTKASVKANTRAHQGEVIIKSVKEDKQQVQLLESKVQALQEWALASSEAKNLAQERVRLLESQLRAVQTGNNTNNMLAANIDVGGSGSSASERILLSKGGSLVVGAGDTGVRVFTLSQDAVKSVRLSERVVLRWQFDLIQEDATIDFSIMKADNSDTSAAATQQRTNNANYIVKDRLVTGGAAGETENAFAIQNACTLLWSNAKAWVRPKTVKYTVIAVAVSY